MLRDILTRYLAGIEAGIRDLGGVYVERYEEEVLADDRMNLRIRLRFANAWLLELNEAVAIETGQVVHLEYRYHLQDGEKGLIFRYDNTPHFPELLSFPHDKHIEGKVLATERPSFEKVIEEVRRLIQ